MNIWRQTKVHELHSKTLLSCSWTVHVCSATAHDIMNIISHGLNVNRSKLKVLSTYQSKRQIHSPSAALQWAYHWQSVPSQQASLFACVIQPVQRENYMKCNAFPMSAEMFTCFFHHLSSVWFSFIISGMALWRLRVKTLSAALT